MPSIIAVDSSLHDTVVEYTTVVEHFAQAEDTPSFAEEVAQYAQHGESDDEEVEYAPELYATIAANASLLNSIPDREFENVAILAVYILSLAESDEPLLEFIANLVGSQEIAAKVEKNKKKVLKLLSLVSVLSTVYNSTESAAVQGAALAQILSIARALDDSSLLKPIAQNVDALLASSNRDAVLQVAELISKDDELEGLRLHRAAITGIQAPSQELVDSYVVKALNAAKALDLEHIVSDATISSTASAELVHYTKAYLYSAVPEFAALTTPANVDKAIITQKSQYLNLLKLGTSAESLPYATIAKELQLADTAAVELLLVNAIKLSIIEGKISQVDSAFHVYRVKLQLKQITKEDWTSIKANLLEYKTKLADVRQLLEQLEKKKQKSA